MKKGVIVKLVVFNISVILINVLAILAFDISPFSEDPIKIAASVTIIAMSVISFFVLNYRWLTAPSEEPVNADVLNKNNYRMALQKYKRINPVLDDEIDLTIHQIESIGRKKEKLIEVLNRNQTYNENFIDTAEETEIVILSNARYILNRITIWDEKDYKVNQNKPVYQENLSVIKRVLDKNEEILIGFDRFLMEASNLQHKVISNDDRLNDIVDALKQLNSDNLFE